ncbi:ankyrin [Hypomontagnella submonticulosa]|nr:ankyrin [Hypomontagnella submonticulosa]
MEVIAVVASFVAIGQALVATPRIIEALKSIVKVKQEVVQLLNVEYLDALGRFVRQHILEDDSAARLPPPFRVLLRRVQNDLESTIPKLDKYIHKCLQKAHGRSKVSRLRWLKYKSEIVTQGKKAKKSCDDLQQILVVGNFVASRHNERLLLDIHAVVVTGAHPGYFLPPPLQFINETNRVRDIDAPTTDDEDGYETAEEDLNTVTDRPITVTTTSSSHQINPSDVVENGSFQIRRSDEPAQNCEPLVQVTATLRGACPRGCACQCHSYTSRRRPYPATSFVYGWLQSNYNSVPKLSRHSCDVPTCRRAYSPVRLKLRVPLLFCSRALEASLSFGSVVGIGSSLHLCVTRTISDTHIIWGEIEMGKIERVLMRISRGEVSPFDGDQSSNIIEYAILNNQWRLLSILLGESMATFRGTDSGRQVAMYARYHLSVESISQEQEPILQKAIALDDGDEDASWPIHEAVRNGGDLSAILKESSEGIDELNNGGQAPLHWAICHRNIAAFRTLISHGANLDVRDWNGSTPLMDAASCADEEWCRILIDRGCDIHLADYNGRTALYCATQSTFAGSAKTVKLLLDHDADFNSPIEGNAIQALARDPRAAEIVEKFRLLVLAGKSLEQEVETGAPLSTALRYGNEVMLHLLLNAGCKFGISPGKDNIIFHAAYFGVAECIDILERAEPTVDVRVRRTNRKTPLDVFNWTRSTGDQWLSGSIRRPSQRDIEAFGRLLKGTRDRYLTTEIQTLETVVGYLKAEDTILAREALQPVIREKVHWNIPAEYRTFRAVDVQIREKMIEAAVESLEEFIQVSRERIGTDPFEGDYCLSSSLEDQGLITEDAT